MHACMYIILYFIHSIADADKAEAVSRAVYVMIDSF